MRTHFTAPLLLALDCHVLRAQLGRLSPSESPGGGEGDQGQIALVDTLQDHGKLGIGRRFHPLARGCCRAAPDPTRVLLDDVFIHGGLEHGLQEVVGAGSLRDSPGCDLGGSPLSHHLGSDLDEFLAHQLRQRSTFAFAVLFRWLARRTQQGLVALNSPGPQRLTLRVRAGRDPFLGEFSQRHVEAGGFLLGLLLPSSLDLGWHPGAFQDLGPLQYQPVSRILFGFICVWSRVASLLAWPGVGVTGAEAPVGSLVNNAEGFAGHVSLLDYRCLGTQWVLRVEFLGTS